MLTSIRTTLAALPPLSALVDTIRQRSNQPADSAALLRVGPLLSAARVPVVAALADQLSRPLLYIVHNTDTAQRAADNLRAWLAPERVLLYPAQDIRSYEYVAPDAAARAQRLRVLQQLRAAAEPPVVVAPIPALLQPTLSPAELDTATTTVQVGEWQPQDKLLRGWIERGYRSVPMVARPGDMARRGGIVDIWPATDEQPLRIEWFGDEIDSLRRFDPASQRSDQQQDTALVGPPYEVPTWQHEQALAQLAELNTASLRPEAHDEWQRMLEHLETGDNIEAWSMFAPLFRAGQDTTRATVCSHLPPGAVVVFDEAQMLAQSVSDQHTQSEEYLANLVASGELPPGFPRPYLLWEELLAQVRPFTPLDLSNNEDLDTFPTATLPIRAFTLAARTSDTLFTPAEMFGGQLRRLVKDIVQRQRAGEHVVVVTPQANRIQELVRDAIVEENGQRADHAAPQQGQLSVVQGTLESGWRVPDAHLTVYTDLEIFGWRQRRSLAARQQRKNRTVEERAAFLRGLKAGDYVVHIEHGIAVYEGLLHRTVAGVEREYLSLRYASGDRLYVPVDQADRVARYVGAGDSTPQLTRLGTQEWERAKRKARAAVQDMADDLLAIYARRQAHQGYAFSSDNEWQRELEDAFPYIETDDQLQALRDIKQDMESAQPMDRLMCGDVGFGKTEVALRAAFKAVQEGKQVAVLVPTTVLAQQHYTTLTQRMAAFPVNIEMLSRFRSPKEQTAILGRLQRGELDIVVGTHRLLSKDVHFKDLGLLIVDEEQRFGVRHKERLKQIRAEVDVLTLTATPIPRTLHMTLAGIRDMSIINTPPEDRMPIKTYVVPSDDELVRDAIRREIDRGGQVYFVHNRVYSIYHVATHLRTLVPEAEIGVAHGQLDERQLEKTMLQFFSGEFDVLVCTTIIENGLDVPNTNTIIVDDAPNYGLAQLYQLRGRVGRSANRAYAYLLYKPDRAMSEEAQQRLQAIQEATELGAGFRIAMRDLEIRGAGNLLGAEQSGHIAAVGFDLYSRLLEQAVQQLKQHPQNGRQPTPDSKLVDEAPTARRRAVVNEKVLVSPLVTLDLPLTAYLPTDYIPDESVRLGVYQRMVEAQSPDEIEGLRQELRDRFGEVPEPAEHLLIWLHIKVLALAAGVPSVITSENEFIVRLPVLGALERERLKRHFARERGVHVAQQSIRLERRMLKSRWIGVLTDVLEVVGQQVGRAPASASATQ